MGGAAVVRKNKLCVVCLDHQHFVSCLVRAMICQAREVRVGPKAGPQELRVRWAIRQGPGCRVRKTRGELRVIGTVWPQSA